MDRRELRQNTVEKPLRERRCENCANFDEGNGPMMPPTCRINPPNMLVGAGGGIAGTWVPVKSTDWCAHHKPTQN